jgi:predicted nucleotidyltransferase
MNKKDNIMNDTLKIKNRLYHQTPLKILSFLSCHPGEVFSADEILKATKSSKGATNQTLRLLLELTILFREKKGNLFLYKLNADNILLKQFKVFENLLDLQKLVGEAQRYCYEVVLFGSRADGTNSAKSDIDLFIRTDNKRQARKIINKYIDPNLRCQVVMQDPLEFISFKKEDSEFYKQIKKGIILWKGRPAYE